MAVTITPPRVVSGFSGIAKGILRTNPIHNISNFVRAVSGSRSKNPAGSLPSWQDQYADNSGRVTSRPSYPDTSYQAFLRAGGNLLGIGYSAWRDKLVQDYNQANAAYEDWYNSMPEQVDRIREAGLNTNLAYGAASPGSAGSVASPSPSGATPGEVFAQGASTLSSLFGNVKLLAEAATIVNELPSSRFKGRLAKQLDVAAAAGSMNAEFGYLQELNSARSLLGVAGKKATAEAAQGAYEAESFYAQQDLIDYMRHHTESGDYTPFIENSQYGLGGRGEKMISWYDFKSAKVEYQKNKAAYDKVFSDPSYWEAVKDKMIADKTISQGQAMTADEIMKDPNMDPFTKILALQGGLPGFLAKLSYVITSKFVGLFH